MAIFPLLVLHFIIGLFSASMMVLAGSFLIRSFAKNKIQATFIFAGSLILGGVWAICSTIYPAMVTAESANIVYIVGVVASYLMMALIFIFIEMIKHDKVRPLPTFIYGGLFGAISFLLIAQVGPPIGFDMPIKAEFGYYAAAQVPFLILQLLFLLTVAIAFTRTVISMVRVADDPKRRLQTISLLVGSSVGFYGAILALVVVEIVFVPSLVLLVTAIGLSLVAMSFGRDPDIAYLLPYDVSILVVLGSSGTPLYTHRFTQIQLNEILFSGAISAISSLMKESLETRESIKLVEMESRSLVINIRKHVTAFVITNKSGAVLQTGLAGFLDAFALKFKDVLVPGEYPQQEAFASADELVIRYLGFLRGSTRQIRK